LSNDLQVRVVDYRVLCWLDAVTVRRGLIELAASSSACIPQVECGCRAANLITSAHVNIDLQ